jgi:putative transcriptional regulator
MRSFLASAGNNSNFIYYRNNLFITRKSVRLRLSDINTDDELTWIAGSVVLSDSPPQQLKYLRKRFGVKQADLARKMDITPSVLSDYEKGRRPSPGVNFIKRYLVALYELGKSNGKPEEEMAPTPVANVHISQP